MASYRIFDSELGDIIVGSLVRINSTPNDENQHKVGLIVAGADPWRLDSMAQAIIENWLYRETQDDGYLIEPAYVVRIEGYDYIYSESELEIINSPTLPKRAKSKTAD